MREKTDPRQWISCRVKPEEYEIIFRFYQNTACQKLSEYIRLVLLQKPVLIHYRNSSADDFLHQMLELKNELSAIGNNFNQLIKKLHTLDHLAEIRIYLKMQEPMQASFVAKVQEIHQLLQQQYELWLQK